MSPWQTALWIVGPFVILGVLYSLHRLALRLERQGLIYYMHKRSKISAAGSLVGLQKIVEPQAEHVLRVNKDADTVGEDAANANRSPRLILPDRADS